MTMTTQFNTSGVVMWTPPGACVARYMHWPDLDPFTQGYIEALFDELGSALHKRAAEKFYTLNWNARFSDLAGETVQRIIEDCERFAPKLHIPADAQAGSWFWEWRQEGWLSATPDARAEMIRGFPRLTPYLGDDGMVYLREA